MFSKEVSLYKVIAFGALIILLVMPVFLQKAYYLRIFGIAGIYVMLAVSLNFISGLAGQFSLGHAAFYGIGAYTAALVSLNFSASFIISIVAGALVSMIAGVFVGLPAIRLRQVYLAVATLGLGEIVRIVLLNWTDVTRGPMGLPGIPNPLIFNWEVNSAVEYYYLVLIFAAVTIFVFHALSRGKLGLVLRAVRDNEQAVRTTGINTTLYKLLAFVIGGGFAGLAGGLFAFMSSYISPDNFMFNESIIILAMVVIGGLGSLPGSIVGALLLSLAPEFLRFLDDYRMITFGLMLLLMILFRPEGLLSEHWANSFFKKKLSLKPRGINYDIGNN